MKSGFFKIFISPIFLLAMLLAVIGLVNLFSATLTFEQVEASSYFKAQFFYTLLGVLAAIVVSRFSLQNLYVLAVIVYGISLCLLVLVLIMGATRHGALSWLDLGFVRLQPSEIGKIGLTFILARYFSELQLDRPLGLRDLLMPIILFAIPTGLVVLQNDLGSSLFYGFIFGTLVLLQGVRIRYIIIGLLLVMVVSGVSYKFLLKTYQKNRIVSFMYPEKDPRGSGYHLLQSKIAVGSGGIWGKGYKKGQSHKLKFLPERHTDFIFPVLLEEWGFVGGASALFLYFLFLMSGISVADRAEYRFTFFLSLGLVSIFFWHLVINLGGVLGLMPMTGVPLPFFSYGGSSLVANWIGVGCLLALERAS